ncbi:MAG: hypothetical protein ACK40I_00655 [Tabrizicola sp.]
MGRTHLVIHGAGWIHGGHVFDTAQTLAQYETAFHPAMLSKRDKCPTRLANDVKKF